MEQAGAHIFTAPRLRPHHSKQNVEDISHVRDISAERLRARTGDGNRHAKV